MKKKIKTLKNKKIVSLYGDIIGLDALKISQVFEAMRKHDLEEVILDLSNVEYIDSNCLGAIIYCQIMLKKNSIKLILSGPRDYIKTLFRDCSFDQIFEITDSAGNPLSCD